MMRRKKHTAEEIVAKLRQVDVLVSQGRKVAEASGQQDEDDSRVVDEIESLCMNCHDNVSPLTTATCACS